jgi:hypothetical protein
VARSRYADTPVVDNHHFASFRLPVRSAGLLPPDLLEGVRTFDYVLKDNERPDHLAARFWNEDTYWWVLMLVNEISYPFRSGGWTPGITLRVPFVVSDVLEKLQK